MNKRPRSRARVFAVALSLVAGCRGGHSVTGAPGVPDLVDSDTSSGGPGSGPNVAPGLPLILVGDVDLPGRANRFDY